MSIWVFIYLIALALWLLFTVILLYHWVRFAMDRAVTIATFSLYFFGSALILTLLTASTVALVSL